MKKQAQREQLYNLLGRLPERGREIGVHTLAVAERQGYIVERLLLELNGVEPVPAYFTRPNPSPGFPVPAVLYNHAHGNDYELGKEELLAGRRSLQAPPYAEALAAAGYAALCIDHWAFGERRGRTESEMFKEMLWRGQVMWGMMVYDSLRALDYLTSRPDVDAQRIGTIGISMGSTMAWWLAALDTRIKVCIDLCCLTDYQALIASQGLDGHGIYYYVPDLLTHFTTAQINTLIAPRPHLSLAGKYDRLTPPDGLRRIDAELQKVYRQEGVPDAWELCIYDTGHFETLDMRIRTLDFFERWL